MIGASLFAGIGGFDLAMTRNGIHVSAAVEIDKSCREILARHFRYPATEVDVTLLKDVREVTGADLGPCDIITAGWPCQGNSVAGRRGGMADPRSGLWGEVARLLGDARPQWFLGENVPGLLNVNRGRDFGIIIQSLAELGYGVAWRIVDAQYTGVPQCRRRVFLVGSLGDPAGAAQVLFEPDGGGGDSAPGGQTGPGDSRAATVSTLQGGGKRGYRIDAEGAAGGHLVCMTGAVTHTLVEGHDSSEDGSGRGLPILPVPLRETGMRVGGEQDPSKEGRDVGAPGDPAYTLRGGGTPHGVAVPFNFHQSSGICAAPDGDPAYTLAAHHGQQVCGVQTEYAVRRLTPVECERLQGFPDDWTAGQSDSTRYRQLGNAVAVPAAQWVTARIAGYESTGRHVSMRREAA